MSNPITSEDLWAIKRVGAPSTAANGRGVFPVTTFDITTDESLTRLYSIPDSRPLTSGVSATNAVISHSGDTVAFLRKVNDANQVHIMSMDGGESESLTDFPLGAQGMKWLPDGSGLIVAVAVFGNDPGRTEAVVKERSESKVTARATEYPFYRFWDTWLTDGYVTHLFRVDLDGSTIDLTPDLKAFISLASAVPVTADFAVSPDGGQIVLSAALLDYGSMIRPRYELWSISTDSGAEPVRLTPDNPGDDIQPVFLADGRIVFGASTEMDYYGTPVHLTVLDAGAQTPLAGDWDLSPSSWIPTPDGASVLAIAEASVRTRAYIVPLDGSEPRSIENDASVSSPSATNDHLYLLQQSLSRPPELVKTDWAGANFEDVTTLNATLLSDLRLGRVENTTFVGADDDEVQMFIIYPPDFDDDLTYPLVHMIHGGPHGSFGDVWHQRWNAHAFAAPGYVVAMVNFHGSSSFGHAFTGSISGAWGDLPATDILRATDALIDRGFIDPDRMAITGGSYGGYLTTWLGTQTNRFSCAIAHAAVTNLAAMYATDWSTGLGRAAGAEPWEDPIRNARWSPSAHYAGYETPTLVIHGEQDYRVPIGQGLELYGILKAKGVDARLIYFPDENHWILKPNNSMYWYSEVHAWLARYLRSDNA